MLKADGLTKRYGGLLVTPSREASRSLPASRRLPRPTGSGKFASVQPVEGPLEPCARRHLDLWPPRAPSIRSLQAPQRICTGGALAHAHLTVVGPTFCWSGPFAACQRARPYTRSRAAEAAATARQPLPHDDDVLEGDASARARCVRAPPQPRADRARRAVLRARRQCRAAAANPAAHPRQRGADDLLSTHRFDMVEKLCSRVWRPKPRSRLSSSSSFPLPATSCSITGLIR